MRLTWIRRSRIKETELMSPRRPFCRKPWRTMSAAAALLLLTPASVAPLCAQTVPAGQHAALSSGSGSEAAKPEATKPDATKSEAAGDQTGQPHPRGITEKAIDRVREVAKSAGDIFNRVPCIPPKGVAASMGSLPHVASKL